MSSLWERFWSKVDKNGPEPGPHTLAAGQGRCWVWTAATFSSGYGYFCISTARGARKQGVAHRVAYELIVGPIDARMELDHRCRRRECVNPDHLEQVTGSENVRRGVGPSIQRTRPLWQTHCNRGHPFGPQNTRIGRSGQRVCRTCVLTGRKPLTAEAKVRKVENARRRRATHSPVPRKPLSPTQRAAATARARTYRARRVAGQSSPSSRMSGPQSVSAPMATSSNS